MTRYIVGDVARISTSTPFADIDGTPFDPGVVKFSWKPPGGEAVEKVYDTDPEVVRNGVGDYHVDVELTSPNKWHYRVEGTTVSGDLQGADQGTLVVDSKTT